MAAAAAAAAAAVEGGSNMPVLELRARISPPHCFSKVVFTLFKIGINSTLESSEQKICLTTFQL